MSATKTGWLWIGGAVALTWYLCQQRHDAVHADLSDAWGDPNPTYDSHGRIVPDPGCYGGGLPHPQFDSGSGKNRVFPHANRQMCLDQGGIFQCGNCYGIPFPNRYHAVNKNCGPGMRWNYAYNRCTTLKPGGRNQQ